MTDKKHKCFVCRVNRYSIYFSSKYAKKDADRFIILKNNVQVYDTYCLYSSITHCLPETDWSKKQRTRFIRLASEFDPALLMIFCNLFN